jgi:hypothetical protein
MAESNDGWEADRGQIVPTVPWAVLISSFERALAEGWRGEPMLKLVQAIAASPAAALLHGATSMHALFISDEPDFYLHDNTLHIRYLPEERQFFFYHQSYSGGNDQKVSDEASVLETLRLFLGYKFGVPFES